LINAASPGDTIALSGETYAMTGTVAVGKNIIITTEPGAAVILLRDSAFTGDMIKVTAGGLTLQADTGGSLTLDGNKDEVTASGSLVRVESTGSLTMNTGVTLQKNKTSGDGGGVYMDGGTLTMTGGSITLNEAGGNGGGIYNDGITSSSTMANVTISGNTANGNGSGTFRGGGGMYNYNSSPVLVNVTISGNLADVPHGEGYFGGGGMSNSSSSSPVLINVRISGNTAIVANDSTNGGGGMYNYSGSSPVLINVTIAGNEAVGPPARGGGMYNSGGSPVIRNSIIWGNTASASNPGIYSDDTPSIEYSMVDGESGGTDGNQPAPAASPFTDWKDPDMYAPTTDGDYRLKDSATAAAYPGLNGNYPIDSAGDWNTASPVYTTLFGLPGDIPAKLLEVLQNDLGGADRFFNGTIDMGAYEF
jgi:hypothetical protein